MEFNAANKFINQTLVVALEIAEMSNGVHFALAPQDAEYPYILFSHSAGVDVNGTDASRVATNLTYIIKVVGREEDFSEMDDLLALADDAITSPRNTPITIGAKTYNVNGAYRTETINYPEKRDDGISIHHVGGLYRLFVSES